MKTEQKKRTEEKRYGNGENWNNDIIYYLMCNGLDATGFSMIIRLTIILPPIKSLVPPT